MRKTKHGVKNAWSQTPSGLSGNQKRLQKVTRSKKTGLMLQEHASFKAKKKPRISRGKTESQQKNLAGQSKPKDGGDEETSRLEQMRRSCNAGSTRMRTPS